LLMWNYLDETSLDVLLPRVERFNEFLRCYPHQFADLVMWHYVHERSPNYAPVPIPPRLVRPGALIFLGRLQSSDQIDYELILDDFERLLPLYRYVEGQDAWPAMAEPRDQFRFKSGCTVKPVATKASVAERWLDVSLRHNEIQQALYQHLVSLYGLTAVGTECPSGTGGLVDVVVHRDNEYWYYEIKTAISAKGCIREALAQMLDYSFWPGAQEARRLTIVGEPILDSESRAFLALLRERFSLPINYQQFDLEKRQLLE